MTEGIWVWAIFISLLVLALWAFATHTPWGLIPG